MIMSKQRIDFNLIDKKDDNHQNISYTNCSSNHNRNHNNYYKLQITKKSCHDNNLNLFPRN